MYTAIKLGDSINKQTRRRVVTVKFSDGQMEPSPLDPKVMYFNGTEFEKDFSFNVEMTELEMKKVVKEYLDELNYEAPAIADGVIDVSDIKEPVEPTPDPAVVAKQEWDADLELLKKAKELVDLGVIPENNPKYVALVSKVRTGLKVEYIG